MLLDNRWKGIRPAKPRSEIQLYDLQSDVAEQNDLASARPEIVERVADIMRTAHVDNEYWEIPPVE